MSLKNRLEKMRQKKNKLIKHANELKRKGAERTEQQRAEKLRKKSERIDKMKPGGRKAIAEGLALKKKPMDVMREELDRRKRLRDEKYGK